jgi:signal transduction histidine kinase
VAALSPFPPVNSSVTESNLEQLGEVQLRLLVRQLREENRKLAELSGFLQASNEREKASLARELHDSLGGILTPAKMDLAWLETRIGQDPQFVARMKRLGALIDEGIDLKRRIIEKLRPSLLDHLGLAAALQWHVDEACRQARIDCKLQLAESLERLSPDLEIALFRLVQESIANVVEHAHAKNVELRVEREEGGLSLCVSDDGVGIADVHAARDLSRGLAGMVNRVRSLQGTFDLDTRPQAGTRIRIFVPL